MRRSSFRNELEGGGRVFWYLNFDFFFVFNTTFSGGGSWSTRRATDPGQATGKLYHLQLRVECTRFVMYKPGRKPTWYWW